MSPVPAYGGRMVGDRDSTPGWPFTSTTVPRTTTSWAHRRVQVIHDCLDQYEQHLEFLRRGPTTRQDG